MKRTTTSRRRTAGAGKVRLHNARHGHNLYGTGKAILSSGMSFASREDPMLWEERGLEVYMQNGFWWYRNADPSAGAFVRQWMRNTDPQFSKHIDYAMAHGELTSREANPSAVKRFLGGAFRKASWVITFDEFLDKARAEMVRLGSHPKGQPLEPYLVDALRQIYDDAAAAYRHGPEEVDKVLAGYQAEGQRLMKGTRRNPLDLATIVGVGVLAGATQAVVQPWATKHVYGVDHETEPNPAARAYIAWHYPSRAIAPGTPPFGRKMTAGRAANANLDLETHNSPVRWIPLWPDAPPEPVIGMVGNPAGNARFYADQDDWPLQGGRQWWAVYDSVTREKMNVKGRGQRPVYGSEKLAQRAADRLNKDWAAGRIEVVAENPRKEVTDRALRYRANATPPPGPRRCSFCGAARVEVGHVNGHEEDNAPANLIWTCRPCNVRCGNTLRAAGVGRLTRQYNPDAKGAQSLGQWIMAINSMKGIQGEMTVPAAVAMIRATPPEDRADFQAEAWRKRKRLYGKSGRQESIPF